VTRRFRLPGGRRTIAIITILAIAGTLSSCGRYGKPVRVAPATEDEHAALVDTRLVNESSGESDEAIVTEETEETEE
jgi:hypothetical protein